MKKLLLFITLSFTTFVFSAPKPKSLFAAILAMVKKPIRNSMVRSNKGDELYKISDIKFQQRHVGAHDGF